MPKSRSRRSKGSSRKSSPKSPVVLYHGSPIRLDVLEPRTPRGNTNFQRQTAVFLSSNKVVAQLYALARDTERKNKGWAIVGDRLILRQDLWDPASPTVKYRLNDVGYLYTFRLREVYQNPSLANEWVSLVAVRPDAVEEVHIRDVVGHIAFMEAAEFRRL